MEKKQYKVEIIDTRLYTIYVEASSENDAKTIAEDFVALGEYDHVIDHDDFDYPLEVSSVTEVEEEN